MCACVRNVHDYSGCDNTVTEWRVCFGGTYTGAANHTTWATPQILICICTSDGGEVGGGGGSACLSISGLPELVLLSTPSQLPGGGRERVSFRRLHLRLSVVTRSLFGRWIANCLIFLPTGFPAN